MSIIEVYADNLTKKDCKHLPRHIAARAVVIHQEKVLLLYLKKNEVYNLPGGGLEKGETLDQCVLRELKEETGYLGLTPIPTMTVIEYYPNGIFESHFYRVDLASEIPMERNLTEEEIEQGIDLLWLSIEEALERLDSSPTKHPHGQNIHARESLGLFHSIS